MKKNGFQRKILFVFIILAFVTYLVTSSHGDGYSMSEQGFKKALADHYSLLSSGSDEDAREIYQDFLRPEDKKMSEEEFVSGFRKFWQGKKQKAEAHSIQVNDSVAIVDRTTYTCSDEQCQNITSRSRAFKKYHYLDGKWKMEAHDYYCPRTENYQMEPEFSRALSLIQQRATEAGDETAETFSDYAETIRCISVEYASSDEEISNAEGVFRFIPGQSAEKLSIHVSPRYKSKDDILTAVLLMHEVTHAVNYVYGLYEGNAVDCYLDEAQAFANQNWFLTALNDEEKRSILARLQVGGSEELVGISRAFAQIPKYSGLTYEQKALNFVKASPSYQKQCDS